MRLGRGLLGAAALLLTATALFHASGYSDVTGSVEESLRPLMALLWILPTASWLIVALFWAAGALRPTPAWRAPLFGSLLVPAVAAIGMAALLGLTHPGLYLLLAAAVLALAGALRIA